MQKILLCFAIAIALAGCGVTPSASQPATQEKLANTTLQGTLVQQGQLFMLQQGGKNTTLDSYTVKLGEYTGKRVTVSGQYSGDTLFVDSISE